MPPAIFQGRYDALTFYQLATLCRLHYTADPADSLATIQHGTGRRHTRTNLFTGVGAAAPPTMVLEFSDYKIVVIRGTFGLESWYSNLASVGMIGGVQPSHGVAAGWYPQAQAIYTAVFPSAAQKEKPCLFIGHSSGGAIALLLAYLRRAEPEGWVTAVASFGSPRTMNRASWAVLGDAPVFRSVRTFDMVDNLPPVGFSLTPGGFWGPGQLWNNFEHGGTLLYLDATAPRVFHIHGTSRSLRQWASWVIETNNGWAMSVNTADTMFNAERNTFAAIAAEHNLWQYCRDFRRLVVSAPRGPLACYDSANVFLNIADGFWASAVDDFKDGYAPHQVRLPEDLAFPPVIAAPVVVPADVPAPDPAVPMPSAPVQQQERVHRRRRVMG